MAQLRIGLVGIGGYGNNYGKVLLEKAEDRGVVFVGGVDPFPEGSPLQAVLVEKRIPIFPSLKELYAHTQVDLLVISSPIHYHAEQARFAMEMGSHVLLEKPLCATLEEAKTLRDVRNRTRKFFAVGFQWAFDDAFRKLKKDVLSGKLGRPRRLSALVLWPRDTRYYQRSWTGKMKSTEGNWILDSVANNATAHFLHAMLYLLGSTEASSALPSRLVAELYRANSIETFDTVAARIFTLEGIEICFYASHAVPVEMGPLFRFEFEKGTVFYNDPSEPESRATLVYRERNGQMLVYGIPDHRSMEKIWKVVDAIRGRGENLCPLESALSHTLCIAGLHRSVPEVALFPASLIRRTGEPELIWVEGLQETLSTCYQKGLLPSEMSVDWARAGRQECLSLA